MRYTSSANSPPGQEVVEHGEAVGPDDVQAPLPLFPHSDEAGVLEHLQVLRDGLLGDVKMGGDLADRTRLIAYESEHLLPSRLGQRAEGRLAVHFETSLA